MVMLQTRIHEIWEREGFAIELTHKKKRLKDLKQNGVIGPYPFKRRISEESTVDKWKKDRFEETYPGYSCNVLTGDGKIAPGQTKIKTVRNSY